MELFLTSDDRYKYLKKNWSKELALKEFYLISRIEYFPVRFELQIDLFNPDEPNRKLNILFSKVTSFVDTIYELEVFDQDNDYSQIEDPIDFIESKKGDIIEYFIHTHIRELWFRTNQPPKVGITD